MINQWRISRNLILFSNQISNWFRIRSQWINFFGLIFFSLFLFFSFPLNRFFLELAILIMKYFPESLLKFLLFDFFVYKLDYLIIKRNKQTKLKQTVCHISMMNDIFYYFYFVCNVITDINWMKTNISFNFKIRN